MIRHLLLLSACVLLSLSAAADELPTRKAGLWEIKVQVDGHTLPLNSIQQCTDAATDKLMIASFSGNARQACPQKTISNSDGIITIDSVCKLNGSTATTHAVISGDFNAAYTVKVTSKRTGGRPLPHMAADGEMHITMQAKWVGACGKGQRPGDLIMPGGIKINVKDLAIKP